MKRIYDLDSAIRKVPDFPKPGILFYDISSLIAEPEAFRAALDGLEKHCRRMGAEALAAIEARGFVFGGALADRLGLPLVLVRKKGKLPGRTLGASYQLEYGSAEIEIHAQDLPVGKRLVLVDDLIATGGTLAAAARLFSDNGVVVAGAVGVVGLPFLDYEKALAGMDVAVLLEYFGE